MIPPLPAEVVRYIRRAFHACDRELGMRLARVPNVQEGALDMALIDCLAGYSSPTVVASDWTVRIDTHFLGGRRHFASWEVADIGVLVFVRLGGKLRAQKVALLQSKRLFPDGGAAVIDDTPEDYYIGFGRLLSSADATAAITKPRSFSFSLASKYKSLTAGDHQVTAIAEFEKLNQIPVHYLLYNPWNVPVEVGIPLTAVPKLVGRGSVGTCVVPSTLLLQKLKGKSAGFSPSLGDLQGLLPEHRNLFGWRIDHFIGDLVLGCKEGKLLGPSDKEPMADLFSRRSGPISAAIAVAIEGPDQ